ncbi:MAG: hypothetical protein J1E96_01450 [Ruminococcus sp.]|nr:hypothetical protein [Ruminococcus sp.]
MEIFTDWITYYHSVNADELIIERDDDEFMHTKYKSYLIKTICELKTCEITKGANLVAILYKADIDDAKRYIDALCAVKRKPKNTPRV